MHKPQEMLFKVIHDTDVLELLYQCLEDMDPARFIAICNYNDGQAFSMATDCKKSDMWKTDFDNDRDLICYLVNRDKLPEGDYLIIISE